MADRDDGASASPIELAPLSVGAGFARAARWLVRLPRLWYRGWLSLPYAVGTEPHYLAGPSAWLARNELARRSGLDRDRRDGGGHAEPGGDVDRPTTAPPSTARVDSAPPAAGVPGRQTIDATFADVR